MAKIFQVAINESFAKTANVVEIMWGNFGYIRSLVMAGFLLIAADVVFGQDWSLTSAPMNPWKAIACSADGRFVLAAAKSGSGGPMYSSFDSGAPWVSN